MITIESSAGRPYGHVPGHTYLDVDITVEGRTATLIVTSGSSQGGRHDQEWGRTEYSRRGSDASDAVERVRDAALAEERDEETRRYIETAASRALGRSEEEAA